MDEFHFDDEYFGAVKYGREFKLERLSEYYQEIYDLLCEI